MVPKIAFLSYERVNGEHPLRLEDRAPNISCIC
jgi:hypothetical protein